MSYTSFGLPLIDDGHDILFKLVGDLEEALGCEEEQVVLLSLCNTLIEYLEFHCVCEQKLMEADFHPHLLKSSHANRELAEAHKLQRDRLRDALPAERAAVVAELKRLVDRHVALQGDHVGAGVSWSPDALAAASAVKFAAMPLEGDGLRRLGWSSQRILVVDDNRNFCQLVRTILDAIGALRVEVVHDGQSGLDELDRETYDLVICDWMMSPMDGLEFARLVSRRDHPPKLVMVSGYPAHDLQARAAAEGISVLMEKPISPQDLLETLMTVALDT